MRWCAQIIGNIMTWRPYLFVCILHYLGMIIKQTCLKALIIFYIVYSFKVCLWLSSYSQFHFVEYMVLWVFDLHISLLMIVRISVFHLIIKSEIWTFSNCSSLGHERIFYSVCLAMFFIKIFVNLLLLFEKSYVLFWMYQFISCLWPNHFNIMNIM